MLRGIVALIMALLVNVTCMPVAKAATVHHNAMSICAIIINELSEGRISIAKAKRISLAIARAGNKHFGRTTCGDMWLYMAIAYVESGFKNNVINRYNCRGMFQIHAPSWARKFGLRYSDLLDVETNADIGVQVFKYYLRMYKRLIPTLSAYNSDHPRAARRYARTVLSARKRIKKRYTELYKAFRSSHGVA